MKVSFSKSPLLSIGLLASIVLLFTACGKTDDTKRCRATLIATRDVSQVSHRRPVISADAAVVPDPQVGSNTRSLGSVVIRMHLSSVDRDVWTTKIFGSLRLWIAPPMSSHTLDIGNAGKSSR